MVYKPHYDYQKCAVCGRSFDSYLSKRSICNLYNCYRLFYSLPKEEFFEVVKANPEDRYDVFHKFYDPYKRICIICGKEFYSRKSELRCGDHDCDLKWKKLPKNARKFAVRNKNKPDVLAKFKYDIIDYLLEEMYK